MEASTTKRWIVSILSGLFLLLSINTYAVAVSGSLGDRGGYSSAAGLLTSDRESVDEERNGLPSQNRDGHTPWNKKSDFYDHRTRSATAISASDKSHGEFDYAVSDADKISISTSNPIPEPATMFMLGLGLISLASIRRKMKK